MAWSKETKAMVASLTDEERRIFQYLYNRHKKDPGVALLLSIVLGMFGVDRFYIGDTGIGWAKLALTLLGGIGLLWWMIDIFLIWYATERMNEKLVPQLIVQAKQWHQSGLVIPPAKQTPALLTALAVIAFLLVLTVVCIALYKAVSSTPATMP